MASLCLLLLITALIHTAQSLPAAHGGGRGLDVSVGGVRRLRRDLHNLLPYEEQMSYLPSQGVGGTNDQYYVSDDWRGRGLDQALQRLVERDQRRELEEEQRAAYLAALLRLLTEAQSLGLVGPGDLQVVEEEQDEEEEHGPPEGPAPSDYDETEPGLVMGRPPAAWWGLLEPQLAQALLDRMEPQRDRARQQQLQAGRLSSGLNQEALRRAVARILSGISPNGTPVMSSGRRLRRELSTTSAQPVASTHRRTRRSLDGMVPPLPSNSSPLLRVKRLEDDEDEEKVVGLQRMKHVDTMTTASMHNLDQGSHRRQRRALTYDPQILIDQILDYMRE